MAATTSLAAPLKVILGLDSGAAATAGAEPDVVGASAPAIVTGSRGEGRKARGERRCAGEAKLLPLILFFASFFLLNKRRVKVRGKSLCGQQKKKGKRKKLEFSPSSFFAPHMINYKKLDAWRAHPMLTGTMRASVPGLAGGTALFLLYVAFDKATGASNKKAAH